MKKPVIILIVFFGLLVVLAIISGLIAPHDPLAQNVERRLEPPSRSHLMGTDGFGRDQLSRVIVGARNTVTTGFLAITIATVFGIAIGSVSAQLGGAVDLVLQRFVDILLGIPLIVLCIVLVVSLRPTLSAVAIALGVAFTPQVARFSRSVFLPILNQPFVEAALLSGAGKRRVFLRHLLPNSFPPLISYLSTLFGASIMAEAALSFLGLGIPPPYPSLGRMLKEGAALYLEAAPWLTIFPGLAIAVIVCLVTLISDSLSKMTNRGNVDH